MKSMKKIQMLRRNADICMYYLVGHTVAACALRFRLSRYRVLQIVKAVGVWKFYGNFNSEKHKKRLVTHQLGKPRGRRNMTVDEKKIQMTQRDAAICEYYVAGHKIAACASQFKLGRQRILQIIKAAGVWKPYTKMDRTRFLGVNVTDATKGALKVRAGKRGISVSQLSSDILDEAVK